MEDSAWNSIDPRDRACYWIRFLTSIPEAAGCTGA